MSLRPLYIGLGLAFLVGIAPAGAQQLTDRQIIGSLDQLARVGAGRRSRPARRGGHRQCRPGRRPVAGLEHACAIAATGGRHRVREQFGRDGAGILPDDRADRRRAAQPRAQALPVPDRRPHQCDRQGRPQPQAQHGARQRDQESRWRRPSRCRPANSRPSASGRNCRSTRPTPRLRRTAGSSSSTWASASRAQLASGAQP